MSASIYDKIFIPLNLLRMSINLLLINSIGTIEVVLDNVELCCTIHDWSMHHFSEREVKCTHLPTGVACEKLLRIFVARSYQRHTFLPITRYSKVGELFKKSLFPLLEGQLVLLSIHLLLNGSINRFTDLINSLFLVVLPKVKDFIWLYSAVF